MQINIQGHHVDLTDSMQDYVQSKFQKLERFFDHINQVQVVLKVEKTQPNSGSYAPHQSGRNPRVIERRKYVCSN